MRKKINLGKVNSSRNGLNIKNNEILDQLYKFLKYQRGQSDTTIRNTMIYARAIINRYKKIEFTSEMGEQIWHDWESEGAAEPTIRHALHTLELIAQSQKIPLKLGKPKLPYKEVDFLSIPELRAVLSAADTIRDKAILYTLFYAGIRAMELCSLKRDALDLSGRRLYIRGKVKNKQERIIILRPECCEAIEEWLRIAPNDSDYIFTNAYGGMLSRRALHDLVRHAGERAGIDKHVYPHLLRHSCATTMVRSGVPLPVVQKHLGHSPKSFKVTMRYLHANMEDVQEAIDSKFVL